ncbi:MAG: ureidoglycolate lyase [Rubrimonas sp.]
MTEAISARPLTRADFAPFGFVIETPGPTHYPINAGRCIRHHDLAPVELDAEGRAVISIFVSKPVTLPYALALMERHPLGSQAFVPLQPDPFLVIAAEDNDGAPGRPQAFLTTPGQGVSFGRNVWHGVLTPLGEAEARFLVVDRGGPGTNLQEHAFNRPWMIVG